MAATIDKSWLAWPFLEERHRALERDVDAWAAKNISDDHADVDAACRAFGPGPEPS